MFTIFNIINYLTGKYVPPIILILITISIYSYIIYDWFIDLMNANIIYFSIANFSNFVKYTKMANFK